MKRFLTAILVVSIQFSAFAEPGKRESVRELLELMNADSMIDATYAQMDQMFAGMGQQLDIKPSEQEIFDNYIRKVTASMQDEMSWEKMEGPMVDIYLNNYTEKEIQDMLTFYRSDTGKSMIEKMPTVIGESMAMSQQLMQGFTPRLQELLKELREELEASRK